MGFVNMHVRELTSSSRSTIMDFVSAFVSPPLGFVSRSMANDSSGEAFAACNSVTSSRRAAASPRVSSSRSMSWRRSACRRCSCTCSCCAAGWPASTCSTAHRKERRGR